MVSQSASRDRLLAAATREFAARGFDGAKVDRIAAKARVNKAMLYYHFHNKAALYQEIVGEMFAAMAAAVTAVSQTGGDPRDRLRQWIRTVAVETAKRPDFPAIWLREMAEGGRHISDETFADIRTIMATLGGLMAQGRAAGALRDANPFVVQLSIVAPMLLFSASTPLRARFAHMLPPHIADVPRESLVDYIEAATFAALSVVTPASVDAVPTKKSLRRVR